MLVAIPIIAVQYPRFYPPYPTDTEPNTADPGFDGAGEKNTAAASHDSEAEIPITTTRAATTGAHAAERKPWERPRQDEMSGVKRGVVQSGGGKAIAREKKPWDPPFAMSPKSARDTYRFVGRSASPVLDEKGKGRITTDTTEEEMEDIFEPMRGHVPSTEPVVDQPPPPPPPAPLRYDTTSALTSPPELPPPTPKSNSNPAPAPFANDRRSSPSLFQSIALVLVFIIFVFAFAVLIAHCLAWFIVYKTESRLGEVRKGLLRGGDMRVCLCAHG